ncbi:MULTISPECIES: SDR family NAD(P)-dependent oxidoreductase [Pseudomonas syringae group]|uniref:Putative short chain alcohol dehydrogenase n=1 Tax=Pseudomonas syringae pv. ribicola TaxID=55398 RepID=A0A3M2VVL6_PSESI|nr:SDR family NAD(P)-dependent oxidoreductase [Pseudomonas syringae group genomosp. 3]RML43284.1 putative short chain alcohol dehydrogenase [Pseudomonas syringae pv. ribicola]
MSRTIVLFGAGSGLGAAVARKYGLDGYNVVLVGRHISSLQSLVTNLKAQGVGATTFIADLSMPEQAAAIAKTIINTVSSIDIVYYGPNQADGFFPATALNLEKAQHFTNLYFLSLVAVINEVLPQMRASKSGSILVSQGSTAVHPVAYLCGPGPAMAAARNYLSVLHGELKPEDVSLTMITIGALIKDSSTYLSMQSASPGLEITPGQQIPVVDPAELARSLWRASEEGVLEVFYPLP